MGDNLKNTPLANQPELERGDKSIVTFDAEVLKGIARADVSTVAPKALFLPTSLGETMELAKLLAAGVGVPPEFRGKPANCVIIVMQAMRWGLDPWAVASKAYFVNDRVAYEAQLVAAVVNSSPLIDGRLHYDWDGEGQALKCRVRGTLRGESEPRERIVSFAKAAKTSGGSPLWLKDPEQQLAYYTGRAWARLYTPEILLGVYTPDELGAIVPADARQLSSGGAAVDSTPRRGDSARDAIADNTDRLAAAREVGGSRWVTPTQAKAEDGEWNANAAPVDDEDADVAAARAFKEDEWKGWLNTVIPKLETAPKIEVVDMVDVQTAGIRAVAPAWVKARYDEELAAARKDLEAGE